MHSAYLQESCGSLHPKGGVWPVRKVVYTEIVNREFLTLPDKIFFLQSPFQQPAFPPQDPVLFGFSAFKDHYRLGRTPPFCCQI